MHDLAGQLKHCCRKLDIQKGIERWRPKGVANKCKPCKNNALMSASSMLLPLWNKWHSSHVDCRARLAALAREHCTRMWQRKKSLPLATECVIFYFFKHIWIKEVNHLRIIWAWNQISALWTLRWFYSFCFDVSNQIFAELRCIMDHNGTVCGISFGWYGYQHATSRCFFDVLLPDNMHRWVFFDELSWGLDVCFASRSHFGSVL